MPLFQSYKLLEDSEDADPGTDDRFTGRGKKTFLQSLHSTRSFAVYLGEKGEEWRDLTPRPWLAFGNSCIYVFAVSATLLLAIAGLLFLGAFGAEEGHDVLQYIDPLIGTGPGGHVFAGATLPFGMAKPVADTTGNDKMGGFASDRSPITGFSSLHDSGTGGSPSLGNFPIFVQPSCPNVTACRMYKSFHYTHYVEGSVKASPGYFSIDLWNGLRAEMTAAERTSLFKFSFVNATNTTDPVLLLDGSDLPSTNGARLLNVDPETGRITAEGTFDPSFGTGNYKAYQCVDFKGPRLQDTGGFNMTVYPGINEMTGINQYYAPKQGVYVRFKEIQPKEQILVRVGLSWLSRERACENAEREIGDWDFDRLLNQAKDTWREKLSPITIDSKGVDEAHLRNYWSGVYRAFLSPQDYTGENPLWNSTEPYYDSWYCIWDTFRGVHPFYLLVDTISQSRMVRSLIDIYQHAGYLPDCRMSFCKGFTQGGSNADVIIVDSYMKKLQGVDWNQAYQAIIKDAEVQPKNWDIEGRGGLKSWKTLGYIPYQDMDHGGTRTRSISRTVEYAYNDFCIAEMANATDRQDDYQKYSGRASNWQNIYNPDLESMGFKGFPQPRMTNGSWGFQNATLCSALNDCGFNLLSSTLMHLALTLILSSRRLLSESRRP
jgi:predicted alpha-1,2-mannosidase